ncbi:tetratricopeptide repeat protein [Rhodocytophaga rosea]|uniref:Tetratricopeptide repeat protein n=1 Tax=Rhodocytophaga rosea TaxID=2704465 RepID=A0A6C0GTE1_9BACT|nr:tetratricopeptide repeat protein [Rhodocytophaga rosea]QHT71435.1 tetratricopeptide repeat protein [Rhodocytophaga rosea]
MAPKKEFPEDNIRPLYPDSSGLEPGITEGPLPFILQQSKSMSAMVCLFIIAGIALLMFTKFDYTKGLVQHYSEYEDFSAVLPESAAEKFAQAGTALAYRTDHKEYLQPLYALIKDNPEKDSLHYYLGVAYFQLEDPVNAARSFRKVLRQPASKLIFKSEYWLGLSFWQGENIQEAKSIFEKISRQPRHPYREKAASILKEQDFL